MISYFDIIYRDMIRSILKYTLEIDWYLARSPLGAAHISAVARKETPSIGGQAAAASATQSRV